MENEVDTILPLLRHSRGDADIGLGIEAQHLPVT
jgi:hypothetical protein